MAPQQVATTTYYSLVPGTTPSLSALPMIATSAVPHPQMSSKTHPTVDAIPLYLWFILAFALLFFVGAAIYFVLGFVDSRRTAFYRKSMQTLPPVQFSPKDEPFARIPLSYAHRFDLLTKQGNASEITLVSNSPRAEETTGDLSEDNIMIPTLQMPAPCVYKMGMKYDSGTAIPKVCFISHFGHGARIR
jgi:hypothetical protein